MSDANEGQSFLGSTIAEPSNLFGDTISISSDSESSDGDCQIVNSDIHGKDDADDEGCHITHVHGHISWQQQQDQCWTTINRNEKTFQAPNNDDDDDNDDTQISSSIPSEMQQIPEDLRYIKPIDLQSGSYDQHPDQIFAVAFNEEIHQSTATSGPISQNNPLEKEGELSKVGKPWDSTEPGEAGAEHSESYESKLETPLKTVGPTPSKTEPPKALSVKLLGYQIKGLSWMQWRETQIIRGGILADDMGLGKTLSMIALIAASKEQSQALNPDVEENVHQTSSMNHLLEEHKNESPIGDLSPAKRRATEQLQTEHDPSEVLQPKRVCKEASEQLQFENNKDDMVLELDQRAGTLVICPTSVLKQWADEIELKVASNTLKVCIFHGPNRFAIGLSELRRMDLVITSYGTVSSEYAKSNGHNSWLFTLEWDRLILDEAHIIRNTKSKNCKSVLELKSECRWALTGTPIQNSAQDCCALLKFLKVPIEPVSVRNNGIDMNSLIQPLMLRRTKLQLQKSGEMSLLPPLHVRDIYVELTAPEMEVYKILSSISFKIFSQLLRQRDYNNNDLHYNAKKMEPSHVAGSTEQKYQEIYGHFLRSLNYNPKERLKGAVLNGLVLRLRQFCCHPGLMVKMLSGDSFEKEANEEENKKKLESDELPELDKAEKIFKLEKLQPSNPIFTLSHHSAKLRLILDTLAQILRDTNDKIIVVSEWTSFLNLIKDHLRFVGHKTLDYNGKMNNKMRSATLNKFNDINNNKRILLLSLTAGGTGLNLNVANHLLLVDLHWNPQLERQARDRIYRYGQSKPSFIYRFICKDTVEQWVQRRQDDKIEIAKTLLDRDSASAATGNGLTQNDYKQIFTMQ